VQFLCFKPRREIIRMPRVGWAEVGSHWIFVRPDEVITPTGMCRAIARCSNCPGAARRFRPPTPLRSRRHGGRDESRSCRARRSCPAASAERVEAGLGAAPRHPKRVIGHLMRPAINRLANSRCHRFADGRGAVKVIASARLAREKQQRCCQEPDGDGSR
jgi:hypothetical protein